MELTSFQKSLLETRLKTAYEKNPDGLKCPICGATEFKIKDSEYNLLTLNHKDGAIVQSETLSFLPVVALVCETCGNVRLFALEEPNAPK